MVRVSNLYLPECFCLYLENGRGSILSFLRHIPRPRPPTDDKPNSNTKVSFQPQQHPQKKKQNKKSKKKQQPIIEPLVIPKCPCCGVDRQFEFQLMPSLLHVLDVDKHATTSSSANSNNLDDIMSADYGGMNWGTIAVYTCPETSCSNKEEFLVVQASVDETPHKRAVAPSDVPVPISEDQTFDPITEDGNFEGDDDDDDDASVASCVSESDLVFTLDG